MTNSRATIEPVARDRQTVEAPDGDWQQLLSELETWCCELPDRTSPDDAPEMMLIDRYELEMLAEKVREFCVLKPAHRDGRDCPAEFEAWWETYRHRNRDPADYNTKKQIAFDAFYFAALAAQRDNDALTCPICAEVFKYDDHCATDISMGICHAACLEGAAVVDLETGEEIDGKISRYRYGDLQPIEATAAPPSDISDNT